MSSNSLDNPAEVGAGTVIGGFRVDRLLGDASFGSVYEARQLSLGRTVALRLLGRNELSEPGIATRFPVQQRLSAAVHHANIVPTYEAGDWEGGKFVATRFVGGGTLAGLLDGRSVSPHRLGAMLEPISSALAAAHEAGLAHGRVSPQNVLLDAAGTPYLADFGLGRAGSMDADREALAALWLQLERTAARGRRRRIMAPAAAASAALTAIAAVVLLGAGDGSADDPVAAPSPPVLAGGVAFGSDLEPGTAQSMGCAEDPGPNTPACTLSQTSIEGRSATIGRAGVIRSWAVRGAEGDVALQVIGRRNGRTVLRGFSQVERVADGGPHAFATNVSVERGDHVGVVLSPGAAIGARPGPAGTSALRWDGTLSFTPDKQSASRLDREILLRADIVAGGRPELERLSGRRAASAPTGSVLDVGQVGLPGGAVRIELVRVGDEIAVDAFRGTRRFARVDVDDADPDGRLLAFESNCGFLRGFCLRWLNAGEDLPVVHAYRLSGGGSFRLIG